VEFFGIYIIIMKKYYDRKQRARKMAGTE
jgi:hypothetical protein